jgi:glycosyltransferase involved in cell wall biosynthesis
MHTFVTGLGVDEIVAARRAGARVIVTTHSSALGFVCQRGTLMWRGATICDGHVDVRRCAACELQHRGLNGLAGAALSRVPAAMSHLGRQLPGRFGTALGMPDLIAWNRERQARMLSLVDRFVVLTDRGAAIVIDNGAPPHKVAVNRLGVSQTFPPRGKASHDARRPLRVAYLGRFDPIKGVFDLASAILDLPADVRIECEFRGPASTPIDRDTRQRLVAMCARDPRIKVMDVVPSDSIPALMQQYDVVCCPSRCLEGGPTVGLEAMAAGTPVVAANVGGVAEVVEDGTNGRLVPPGDVRALAAALAEIAARPQLLDAWRARLPKPRTMDDVAADYLQLYASAN